MYCCFFVFFYSARLISWKWVGLENCGSMQQPRFRNTWSYESEIKLKFQIRSPHPDSTNTHVKYLTSFESEISHLVIKICVTHLKLQIHPPHLTKIHGFVNLRKIPIVLYLHDKNCVHLFNRDLIHWKLCKNKTANHSSTTAMHKHLNGEHLVSFLTSKQQDGSNNWSIAVNFVSLFTGGQCLGESFSCLHLLCFRHKFNKYSLKHMATALSSPSAILFYAYRPIKWKVINNTLWL